ncbi:hypothetical protein HRH25_22285 [Flavisolibacter sp. BT320]|nr:hypothetical protein [Flavisolibacter longurius]
MNDEFDFTYLYYMYPYEETTSFTTCRRIYYTQFGSPGKLLKAIKPEKVIFMGLDGLQSIAINIECKKQGIPTFLMVHAGAALSVEDYDAIKLNNRKLLQETKSRLQWWLFTFSFLLKALGIRYLHHLPILLRYQWQKTKMHPIQALKKNRTLLRLPGKYLVYSDLDVAFFKQQDNATDKDFIILGNLEIDKFIDHKDNTSEEKYLLYIETPLSQLEGQEFDFAVLQPSEYNRLIENINRYAMQNGYKLRIKLHPYSYSNTYLFKHPNISYLKNCDIVPLILGAEKIIFYNSSLSIPALLFKQGCMLVSNNPDFFQRNVKEIGLCSVVKCDDVIAGNELELFYQKPDCASREKFVRLYIGQNTDGTGMLRLKKALAKPAV